MTVSDYLLTIHKCLLTVCWPFVKFFYHPLTGSVCSYLLTIHNCILKDEVIKLQKYQYSLKCLMWIIKVYLCIVYMDDLSFLIHISSLLRFVANPKLNGGQPDISRIFSCKKTLCNLLLSINRWTKCSIGPILNSPKTLLSYAEKSSLTFNLG